MRKTFDPVTQTRRLRGTMVTVWEDPVTKTREEGPAELVRFHRRDDPMRLEEWEVRFGGEPERTFFRWIAD